MSVIVSHHTASTPLLERLAIPTDSVPDRIATFVKETGAAECFLLSTCNRVETYLELPLVGPGQNQTSMSAASSIIRLLAEAAGATVDEVADATLVLCEAAAIAHLNAVACGLDSMAVGEAQVVAQIREAFNLGLYVGAVGHVLGTAVRGALRVSKSARAQTDLGGPSTSLVHAGLEAATRSIGPFAGKTALLIGAGRTGHLAASLLQPECLERIAVANRSEGRAAELARRIGGLPIGRGEVPTFIRDCDLVVSSTGAPGLQLAKSHIAEAMRERPRRPLFLLDLAMPRDIDPAARTVEQVTLMDIELLGRRLRSAGRGDDLDAVWGLIDQANERFLSWRREDQAIPAIGALHDVAAELVEAETRRLDDRLPDLDVHARREAHAAVRRAVGKLLHTPTVRVRQFSGNPDGASYVRALTELFDLHPKGTQS